MCFTSVLEQKKVTARDVPGCCLPCWLILSTAFYNGGWGHAKYLGSFGSACNRVTSGSTVQCNCRLVEVSLLGTICTTHLVDGFANAVN
jgi:hypothetical protein